MKILDELIVQIVAHALSLLSGICVIAAIVGGVYGVDLLASHWGIQVAGDQGFRLILAVAFFLSLLGTFLSLISICIGDKS